MKTDRIFYRLLVDRCRGWIPSYSYNYISEYGILSDPIHVEGDPAAVLSVLLLILSSLCRPCIKQQKINGTTPLGYGFLGMGGGGDHLVNGKKEC